MKGTRRSSGWAFARRMTTGVYKKTMTKANKSRKAKRKGRG